MDTKSVGAPAPSVAPADAKTKCGRASEVHCLAASSRCRVPWRLTPMQRSKSASPWPDMMAPRWKMDTGPLASAKSFLAKLASATAAV